MNRWGIHFFLSLLLVLSLVPTGLSAFAEDGNEVDDSIAKSVESGIGEGNASTQPDESVGADSKTTDDGANPSFGSGTADDVSPGKDDSLSENTDIGDSTGQTENNPLASDSEQQPDEADAGQNGFDTNETDTTQGASESEERDATQDELELLAESTKAPVLAPGRYIIRSSVSLTRVLDISGGSKASGGNAQLYTSNMTAAQQFDLTIDDKGYYTLTNVGSGLVLDVTGAGTKAGTNVQQYASNGTAAQKWTLHKLTDGSFRIESALKKGLVLDVSAAENKDGANVQVYTRNNTVAQSFVFIPLSSGETAQATIADGRYTITSTLAKALVLDVPSASTSSGVQMQLWSSNNTNAQVFEIKHDKTDGFYTVRPLSSTLFMGVAQDNVVASTAIVQQAMSKTDGQRFAITSNGDGTYTFVAKRSGLVIDVTQGEAKAGAKIQLWPSNGTAAQRFRLTAAVVDPLTEGVMSLVPYTQTGKRVDISGGSRESGANAQAYTSNDTLAQKFFFVRTALQTYTIQSINSGHYLTDTGGNVTQAAKVNGAVTETQKWHAERTYGGFTLTNIGTKNVMILTTDSSNGHDIRTAAPGAYSSNKVFKYQNTSVITPDTYTISTPGSLVIDSANGSISSGTNTQIWTANDTAAQKWKVVAEKNDYFSLRCVRSSRALDIANGATTAGTNVRLWTYNGTNAQIWKAIPTGDGWFYIRSASGMYLATSGKGDAAGQNVMVVTDVAQAQKFRFTVTTYLAHADILRAINSASGAKSFTSFGGYSPSSGVKNKIQTAISRIQNRGYSVGFMMVDLSTGQGIVYNGDQSFYSASTIKGPYVASVVSSQPSSVMAWRSTMEATIRQSSNSGYESLRQNFGPGPLQEWCRKADVSPSIASSWYTHYSTRDLTKLWLQNYTFFIGGAQNSSVCQSWFTSSYNSAIYNTLGSSYSVNTKPGWNASPGWRAANDAGIVWGSGGPYLITVLTNAPANVDIMNSLVWEINGAHTEMMR